MKCDPRLHGDLKLYLNTEPCYSHPACDAYPARSTPAVSTTQHEDISGCTQPRGIAFAPTKYPQINMVVYSFVCILVPYILSTRDSRFVSFGGFFERVRFFLYCLLYTPNEILVVMFDRRHQKSIQTKTKKKFNLFFTRRTQQDSRAAFRTGVNGLQIKKFIYPGDPRTAPLGVALIARLVAV